MPPSPLSEQDVKRIYHQAQPVSRGDFKSSFDRVAHLVAVARQELTALINSKLAELAQHMADNNARINRRLAELKDGVTPDQNQIVKDVLAQIRQPKDGETPVVDHQKIAQMAASLIPVPQNGTNADVKEAVALTVPQVLAELDKRVPLLGDALRAGLEAYAKEFLSKSTINGGTSAIAIKQSGTLKVQSAATLNFTGAGAPTITHDQAGVTSLSFASGGGGGLTALTATETPNGSITIFTFSAASAQPTYLVVDNVWMKATSKAGTVNWTWNGGTKKATLAVPADDDIWGVV